MSHRTRTADRSATVSALTHGYVPQVTKTSRPAVDKDSTASQRLSMASNSSAGRRSSASLDGSAGTVRPSGIPRPTKTSSITRLNSVATSRPANAYTMYRTRTSPNITGITSRTTSQYRSAERIAPSNSTPRIVTDEDLVSLEPTLPAFDMEHDTVFGIAIPQKQLPNSTVLPPRLIPELQALAATTYKRPMPAMSTISTVSSPSTQFTTSPSPWSASTTATTPTSWSSASPALVHPTGSYPITKRSQTVPVPPTVRTIMPKLPVLQETTTDFAASSRATLQSPDTPTSKKSKKKTPLNSPAPTPPTRTSSIKRNRSRSNSKSEDLPPSSHEAIPPLPRNQDISPIIRHVEETATRQKQPLQAHTLTDNHRKLQDALNLPPPRPSRDGIEDLEIRKPQRVNANHVKYNEQARKLLDAAPIEALPHSTSQSNLQSTASTEREPSNPPQLPRSRLGKFSRLGLFGRSPKKPTAEPDQTHQPRKLQRRGPLAGTGHEGYKRFGRRDRRTSTDDNNTSTDSETSVVSRGRKPMRSMSRKDSSSSRQRDRLSQSDLDDFAASRLKPVVILGGSQKDDGGSHLKSLSSKATNNIEIDTRGEASALDPSHHTSVASSGPLLRESRLIFHLDSLDAHEQSHLAVRRSQKSDNDSLFPMPQPINTNASFSRLYPSSYNTSQSSIAPTSAAMTDMSSDLQKVDSSLLDKQRKKSRKLNWGFFRKKEFVPEGYQPRTSSRTVAPKMAVSVSTVAPPRPMPYYAMLESENEISNAEAIGHFLNEAVRATSLDEDEGTVSLLEDSELEPEPEPLRRAESVLLPSAPQRKHDIESTQQKIAFEKSISYQDRAVTPPKATVQARQPRLVQVGRIPKVVQTTQKNNPMQSLSALPFPRSVAASHQDLIDLSTRSTEPPRLVVRTDNSPRHPLDRLKSRMPAGAPVRTEVSRVASTSHSHGRDLKFHDRYSTTSSSSDGVVSVIGPPLFPAPEFPTRSMRYTTTEDDIWNEYDDFIDRVISSPRLKKSTTRITDEDRIQLLTTRKQSAPTEKPSFVRKARKELAVDTSLAPPPLLFGSPMSSGDHGSDQDYHLRRSRIVSALHSSLDPSSPFSIGDYLAELGEARRNSDRTSGRLSDSAISQAGMRSPRAVFTFPEPPLAQTEYKHHQNALNMDESERSKDPARHSERSYASLMVSRWLSFGRVLFSPAHTDVQRQPERHVLVIDGLGNEDWSIYCAVTYQNEHAYIYDLKETSHMHSSTSPPKAGQLPQNFRRRELASFNEAFKFPENFFSVIVLRFPPVMADSKLKNIISECRRVLAPGGYMELVLLDLDIVNMGVLTRRALRDVKTKIAMRNREVSLKPVIDNIQSILGEKGFSKLSKCVVGVPVVGKPPGADSSTSSRSSGGSDGFRQSPSAGPRPFEGLEAQHHNNFSLNDLVADHSDNADAKIGRVVSRTARSWWQHCFEAAVISNGNLSKSIFADKQVLKECKSRASSFKLLIAYTQKPITSSFGTRRRTMSEPVVATLATAKSP